MGTWCAFPGHQEAGGMYQVLHYCSSELRPCPPGNEANSACTLHVSESAVALYVGLVRNGRGFSH